MINNQGIRSIAPHTRSGNPQKKNCAVQASRVWSKTARTWRTVQAAGLE
jgi:hypothetical protein